MRFGPQLAYAMGLGPLFGRAILLLTTIGRKSGRPRVTPLVFEERDGAILIASARGSSADWLRNIHANPKVQIRVGKRNFEVVAKLIVDPNQITDYLECQMTRNPRLFGRILRMEGMPSSLSCVDLMTPAAKRPMVEIYPA